MPETLIHTTSGDIFVCTLTKMSGQHLRATVTIDGEQYHYDMMDLHNDIIPFGNVICPREDAGIIETVAKFGVALREAMRVGTSTIYLSVDRYMSLMSALFKK